MYTVFELIKINGGHLVQLICADKSTNKRLREVGWNSMYNAPDTYFYHRNKSL